jgi:hypothetical protein
VFNRLAQKKGSDYTMRARLTAVLVIPLMRHPKQIMASTRLEAARNLAVRGNSKAPGT